MKRFVPAIAIASLLAIVTPFAHAVPIAYTTVLSGPAEEPPIASPGIGQATVIYDSVARTLEIQTSFSGLEARQRSRMSTAARRPPLPAMRESLRKFRPSSDFLSA